MRYVSLAQSGIGTFQAVPDLASLDGLPDVMVIDLTANLLVDSDLSHARKLRLIRLHAAGSTLGDEGLTQLGPQPELGELNLAGSLVTDAGLEHLARMPRRRKLDLSGTYLTDAGLAAPAP